MVEPKTWLSNVWIIANDSGVCIFEENFKELNLNSDLITGFLYAMINFGKEVADKELNTINFDNLNFCFKRREKYVMTIAVTDDASEKEVSTFLNQLIEAFEKDYLHHFEDWYGNISLFDSFGLKVEELASIKSKKEGILLKSKALKLISKEQEKYKDLIADGKQKFAELIDAAKDDIKKHTEQKKEEILGKFSEIKGKILKKLPLKDLTINDQDM